MASSSTPESGILGGAVAWLDLGTPDVARSREFYHDTFGWEYEEFVTDQGSYFTASVGDRPVAGLMQQPEDQVHAGIGPSWTVFFPSSDLEDDLARVTDAGGSLVVEPFEIPGSNGERIALVADPSGAVFALATFRNVEAGTIRWDEPGSGCWVECHTWDIEASLGFYRDFFGWNSESTGDYHLLTKDGRPMAGLMAVPDGVPAGVPSYWFVYWRVDELDGAIARTETAGGTVVTATMDIDEGRFTVIEDPTGVVVGLFEGPMNAIDAMKAVEDAGSGIGVVENVGPYQSIGTLASRHVVSVDSNSTLRSVIEHFVEGGVSLVVIDDAGSVAGVVGEHDVLEAIHEGADVDELCAADIMSTDLVTAQAEDTVVDVARRMVEQRVRHILVFGDDGGVVSIRDVLEAVVS